MLSKRADSRISKEVQLAPHDACPSSLPGRKSDAHDKGYLSSHACLQLARQLEPEVQSAGSHPSNIWSRGERKTSNFTTASPSNDDLHASHDFRRDMSSISIGRISPTFCAIPNLFHGRSTASLARDFRAGCTSPPRASLVPCDLFLGRISTSSDLPWHCTSSSSLHSREHNTRPITSTIVHRQGCTLTPIPAASKINQPHRRRYPASP